MLIKEYTGYHQADGRFADHVAIQSSTSGTGVGPTYSEVIELGSKRNLSLALAVTELSANDSVDAYVETSPTGADGTWIRARGGAAAQLDTGNVGKMPMLGDIRLASTGGAVPPYSGGTDGFDASSGKLCGFRWNAGSSNKIIVTKSVPIDLDVTAPATLCVLAARIGSLDTTAALDIEVFFGAAGAAYDADADCGGSTGALSAATTVMQKLTRQIAPADLVAFPASITVLCVPSAALDDDDLIAAGLWLEYKRLGANAGGFTQVLAAGVPSSENAVFLTDKFIRAAFVGNDSGTTFTAIITGTAA